MILIPVIGLEIHAELLTETKAFCSCKNSFGGMENTRICPVCTGMPGTLPIPSEEAVYLAAKGGAALGGAINNYITFDRKNYFYPDLPKGYQITQNENPVCSGGYIDVGERRLRINHVHLEEDAGKLVHDDERGITRVDCNRAGVPLIEIVTEPDMHSSDEAMKFVSEAAQRLKYAGVSDARMEQGSLRVDVNVSVMQKGESTFGVRTEIKNIGSIKAVGAAIDFEINRQSEIIRSGNCILSETRRFDERTGTTVLMRSKESGSDYKYFPEPDIPGIYISEEIIKRIMNSIPRMPHERMRKYTDEYHISAEEAKTLLSSVELADYFEAAASFSDNPKKLAGVICTQILRWINEKNKTAGDIMAKPKETAAAVMMADRGIITQNGLKELVWLLCEIGGNAEELAKKHELIAEIDESMLLKLAERVISENAEAAAEYKGGNSKIFGFLMGQMMRYGGKKINPKSAGAVLNKKLGEDK